MVKIRVSFQSEEDREKVINLCRRLGDVKVSETSVTLKAKGSLADKIVLYLGTHPEVLEVKRLKKNKAAR